MASWTPPQRGSPLAMTSILRSSCRWMLSMFKSMSRVFVVTRAPASRQTLAAAFSSGTPRGRSTPAWAQAERWSPKGSRVRRHRQRRADRGNARRRRLKSELLLCFCDCLQRWDGSCPCAKVLEDGGRVGRVLAMENGQCVGPRSPISGGRCRHRHAIHRLKAVHRKGARMANSGGLLAQPARLVACCVVRWYRKLRCHQLTQWYCWDLAPWRW